jgi:hypothetical protein
MVTHRAARLGGVRLAPPAPTGVTVSRDGLDAVLDWSHPGLRADGYRVYRRQRTVGGSFGAYALLVTVTPETDTDHLDVTADGALEYQYEVAAFSVYAESPRTASPILAAVAGPAWDDLPSDDPTDDTSIIGSVLPVIDADGIRFWRRLDTPMDGNPEVSPTGSVIQESASLSFDDDVGSSGRTAYYIAQAYYGPAGPERRYGPYSEEHGGISQAELDPPGTPTVLSTVVNSESSITFDWAQGLAGDDPTVYRLQRSTNGGAYAVLDTVAHPTSIYEDTTVSAGNSYRYRVRGENGAGVSAYAEGSTVCAGTAPSTPTGVAADAQATDDPTSKILVTWTGSSGFVSTYRIRWRVRFSGSAFTEATDAASPYTITGLTDGAEYEIQVRAENPCAASGYTAAVFESTEADAPTEAPTNVTISPTGDTQLQVNWDPPPNATAHDLEWAAGASEPTGSGTLISDVTAPYTHTGRSPNTRYWYRVRGKNSGGVGPFSGWSQGTTLLQAPASLVGLHASELCPTIRVDSSWSNLNAAGNVRTEAMVYQRSNNGGSTWEPSGGIPITAGATSHQDTSATTSTNRVRVRYDSESAWSEDSLLVDCPE